MAAALRQKRQNKSTAAQLRRKKPASTAVARHQRKQPVSMVAALRRRKAVASTAVQPRLRKAAASTAVQPRPASLSTERPSRAPMVFQALDVRRLRARIRARLNGLSAAAVTTCIILTTSCIVIMPLRAENAKTPQYYAEDIKSAMQLHIAEIVNSEGDWAVVDDKTGERLILKFMQIHDPVRQISETVYFACTDFHLKDHPEKVYDMDFWLEPVDGALRVFRSKVHKEPRHALLYGWYKHPRYTFVNDEISYLYD